MGCLGRGLKGSQAKDLLSQGVRVGHSPSHPAQECAQQLGSPPSPALGHFMEPSSRRCDQSYVSLQLLSSWAMRDAATHSKLLTMEGLSGDWPVARDTTYNKRDSRHPGHCKGFRNACVRNWGLRPNRGKKVLPLREFQWF